MGNKFFAELVGAFRLSQALLGAAKEEVQHYAVKYQEALKRLVIPSLLVAASSVVFFSLSELTGLRIFNIVGIILAGGLVLTWVTLAQPIVMIGEQLIRFDPFKRFVHRIYYALILFLVIVLYAFVVPPGIDGIIRIALLILMFYGLTLSDQRILTTQKLGFKIVLLTATFGMTIYFPFTTNLLSSVSKTVNRTIASISPKSDELEMSLENLRGENPQASPLFLEGKPLWWCRNDNRQITGYRCFSLSGSDSFTREELFPISEEIIKTAIRRLEKEEKQIVLQRKADAEQKRIRALKEEKDAHIARYRIPTRSRAEIAIAFSNDQSLEDSITEQLASTVSHLSVNTSVFTNNAVTDGVFSRVFDGDPNELKQLNLALAAKTLLIGKITESFEDNKMVKGAKRAIINAKIRVIDTETGEIRNSKHYSFNKLDYTEAAALNKIREQLINQIVTDNLLG